VRAPKIRHRAWAISLCGIAITLAVVPALALGARGANGAEARAITAAVKHSSLTRLVPGYEYDVIDIRISTAARGWAKAAVLGRHRYVNQVQPAGVVLRLKGGHWRLRTIGGEGLGCGVPRAVARDLKISCP